MLAMNTRKHRFPVAQIPDTITHKLRIIAVDIDARINPIALGFNWLFSSQPYLAVRFNSKVYKKALIELLQTESFDIIQLEGPYLAYYLPVIKAHSAAKVVFRAHNIESEIWKRTAETCHSFFKKIYLANLARRIEKFEKQLVNKYDLLVPITQRDADQFARMGNVQPVCVSPVGVEVDVNMKPVSTEPVLFFIGALDWMPNQEGLLWFLENVWTSINDLYPALRFHIAGRNAPDYLVNQIKKYNVIFEGEVPDAAAFMADKSIMIVPLFSGSGMRVKIIEGMAAGKCIITTPVGLEGIAAQDSKEVMVAADAESYINKIHEILKEPSLITSISVHAQKFIESSFSNPIIYHRLFNFYIKSV